MKTYSDKIEQLKQAIAEAECIFIGAGAGLSTAAGLTYSGERFEKYFSDFGDKYGITDIYSGGFIPLSRRRCFGRGGADTFMLIAICLYPMILMKNCLNS